MYALSPDNKAFALEARITGDFKGTTDEILQWAACKWGFDEDLIRAEAAAQTKWQQDKATDYTSMTGVCPPGAATITSGGVTMCAQTYGMFQVLYKFHQSAWPMYWDSTPFHVDYVLAIRRTRFEGLDLSQGDRVAADAPHP